MRSLMLACLMAISAYGAEDSAKGTSLRVSAGAGAGPFGLVAEARVLAGQEDSPWLLGVQAMGMTEVKFFTTPNENVGSVCLLVGRELIPAGPLSFMVFGGAGLANTELRGRELSSVMFNTTYESVRTTDPVVLLGGDVGLSWRRSIGVSLQFGVHVSRITTPYAALQLDAGSW